MTKRRPTRPMLEMRDFLLVEVVLRLGSLGKASTELQRTASALSHQLADLERRVGLQLFAREGKRLIPSAAAEQLLSRARTVLAEARRAEDEIGSAAAKPAALRLATECYSCYAWLPPVLRTFRAQHPNVDVELRAEASLDPVAALLADEISLALVCRASEDRRLRYWPVFVDELVAVVAPDHEWSQRRYVGAKDLAAANLIVAPVPNGQSRLAAELFAPHGLTPRSIVRMPHTEAILEMARSGLGVGILPRWSAETYLAAGLVHAVRITRTGLQRDWRVAIRAAPDVPRHLSDFVRLVTRSRPGAKA